MRATASRLKANTIARILTSAAMLAITEPAHATTLLSTSVVHGFAPVCLVANIGATSVRVTSMRLIDINGNERAIISGNCNFPRHPPRTDLLCPR